MKIPVFWKEPPEDFTIYQTKEVLERLLGSPASSKERAGAPHRDQAGETAATVRLQDRKEKEREYTFDEAVHFAWKISAVDPKKTSISDKGDPGERKNAENAKAAADAANGMQMYAIYKGRCLACFAYDRALCSITIRRDKEFDVRVGLPKNGNDGDVDSGDVIYYDFDTAFKTWKEAERDNPDTEGPGDLHPYVGLAPAHTLFNKEEHEDRQYKPTDKQQENDRKRPSKFLCSRNEILNVLFPAVFQPKDESAPDRNAKVLRHGLVVVSGQTGSMKSQIVGGLVQRYLAAFDRSATGKDRFPHVLTIEDPIENPLVPLEKSEIPIYLNHSKSLLINFTPRQIGKDVADLAQGLKDALRQTPAVVMVGEIRDREDWKEILKFASTGHFCITTTHAGSLVETMRNIIEASEATTPDRRSSLVEKIIAVIHLRSFDLTRPARAADKSGQLSGLESMLLPAIWRNVAGGANFFVSDGLSAILPRRAEQWSESSPPSCRGRADFARALVRERQEGSPADPVAEPIEQLIRIVSTISDLEGV